MSDKIEVPKATNINWRKDKELFCEIYKRSVKNKRSIHSEIKVTLEKGIKTKLK